MKLFKLTDENGRTRGDTQWGEGVANSGTGVGPLCGPGYVHAYESPLVALLMNPIHANFSKPRLWEAEGEIALRDGQLKCGCVTLTTVREIPLPVVTTEMRIRFAILCAKKVCHDEKWNAWADGWLDGRDRSDTAARAAWAAADTAAAGAKRAKRAAWAAGAAAWAAGAAAWAAGAAAWAAAAEAAELAAGAARTAVAAKAAARASETDFDLGAIAEMSVSVP